jgi:ABC-type dipeptide/oligopeptide/nickel transport system permease subunit
LANTAALPRTLPASDHEPVSHGYLKATWLRLRRDRLTMLALAGLGLVVLLTVLAPLITSQILRVDPLRQDLFNQYAKPSPSHLLGTDDLGRDVLARLLHAGQVSLTIGLVIALVSILIGLPVGLASGYFGGRVDDVSNAIIQTLQNIPELFLLILLSVTLRPDPVQLAFIIGALGWMGTARQVRGLTLTLRARDYIQAARLLGASDRRIMQRHIFPNLFSVVTVIAGFSMASGILAESGLSYLGLGVRPPTASWGNMLNNSLDNISRAPWLVIGPGFMIFFTVLCIFLIADGLRDALDPRLKN